MLRTSAHLFVAALSLTACTARAVTPWSPTTDASEGPTCALDAAAGWIGEWLRAWEFTSEQILGLSDAVAPEIVFYDASCVYTTSAVTAGGADPGTGPGLRGRALPWRAIPHGGMITMPDSSSVPVGLMSFAAPKGEAGVFFVMAAPDFWAGAGVDSEELGRERLITAVFLHEFAHTRQIPSFQPIIAPIEEAWTFPEEVSDNVVQDRFGSDSAYVAAYEAERDLLYRAAAADSLEDVRALAAEALAMMKARHARWFTGDDEVFGVLDDAFLSFEGAGQWTAYAWLVHPGGGGVRPDAALPGVRRGGRWWSQDEGLALFLVLDRLLPDWPARVFGPRPAGAIELLEQAVRTGIGRTGCSSCGLATEARHAGRRQLF
jgi:hypothetical protein